MTDTADITVRPAEATLDDGMLFAHFMDQAAEGAFSMMLGKRFQQIIATAVVQPEHDFSYEHIIFAEADGKAVGMAAGYTAEAHADASPEPLREAATGLAGLRFALFSVLAAPIFRYMGTIPEGDFYLEGLAVDEELRGHGIGSKLMDAMERRAIDSGSARFALDVSAKNEGGRRLYERRGMHPDPETPPMRMLGKDRIVRLAKELHEAGERT
jgi:GNAT superfamily N-acetyltransferase